MTELLDLLRWADEALKAVTDQIRHEDYHVTNHARFVREGLQRAIENTKAARPRVEYAIFGVSGWPEGRHFANLEAGMRFQQRFGGTLKQRVISEWTEIILPPTTIVPQTPYLPDPITAVHQEFLDPKFIEEGLDARDD